jgi:hypothetical protein
LILLVDQAGWWDAMSLDLYLKVPSLNLSRLLAVQTDLLWLSSVYPANDGLEPLNRPWPFPSKLLPVHYLGIYSHLIWCSITYEVEWVSLKNLKINQSTSQSISQGASFHNHHYTAVGQDVRTK